MLIESQRLKFLDGLRGIAALSVVLYHHYLFLNSATLMTFPSLLESVLLKGHLGVQIFFVLSGFVIAYSMRNVLMSWEYIQQFFIKRSIRLDPPYWAALFLMMVASFLFSLLISQQQEWPFTFNQVLSNTLYVQEFLGFDSINPVAWTLCIELQLYLFFAFILQVLCWRLRAHSHAEQMRIMQSPFFTLFFALLLIGSLGYHNSMTEIQFKNWTPQGIFFPYWYSFFLGAATCWTLLGRLSNKWLCLYFALVGVCVILNFNAEMLTGFVVAFTIYTLGKWGHLATLSCTKMFQYLGRISFSLYLIHWLAGSNSIQFLYKRVGELNMTKFSLIYLFSLIISILTAHLFYLWIEAPCLKWSKAFGKEKQATSNSLLIADEKLMNPSSQEFLL